MSATYLAMFPLRNCVISSFTPYAQQDIGLDLMYIGTKSLYRQTLVSLIRPERYLTD